MRIRKRANIDCEADSFRFRFRQPLPNGVDLVRRVFQNWTGVREANKTCDCWFKHLSVERAKNAREIEALFGWFCDGCLPTLDLAAQESLPNLTTISMGTDLSPYPAPDQRFIYFASATAHFEDGTSVPLSPFEICRFRVTIGQYDEFTRATGYVTNGEQNGDCSFRLDETIEPIRPKDRVNMPVHSVSFDDAQAYCDWAGARLPTESELLAAALIHQQVVSRAEKQELMFGKSGRFDIGRFPDALDGLGPEFVVGVAATGKAVIRSGPYYIREVGWEKQRYGQEISTHQYDLMLGFRGNLDPPVRFDVRVPGLSLDSNPLSEG
jgi:hypothetical protein